MFWWKLERWKENTLLFLAKRMPKRLRYWATVVSGAEASQGQWSNVEVPAMLFMDVLKRNEPNHSTVRTLELDRAEQEALDNL